MIRIHAWLRDVLAAPHDHPEAMIGLGVATLAFVVIASPWLLGPILIAGIWLLALGIVVYVAVRLALRHHQPH